MNELKNSKLDNSDIQSVEIKYWRKHKPNMFIQYGNLLLFAVFLTGLMFSFSIKYPEIIEGEVVLSYSKEPIIFKTSDGAILKDCYVKEGEKIKADKILLRFEDEIDLTDISIIKEYLKKIERIDDTTILPELNALINLGKFQADYSGLKNAVATFNVLKSNELQNKKVEWIDKEISLIYGSNKILQEKLKLNSFKLKINEGELNANQKLIDSKAISQFDFNKESIKHLNSAEAVLNIKEAIMTNNIKLNDLTKAKEEMLYLNNKEVEELRNNIFSLKVNLETKIYEWEKEMVWKAKESGIVHISSTPVIGEQYNEGEISLFISPENEDVSAKLYVDIVKINKIKLNQKCQIEIKGFNKLKYGTLQGKVESIKLVSSGKTFEVNIQLEKGLRTTTGFNIPFFPKLLGAGKIFVDDESLFDKIIRAQRL